MPYKKGKKWMGRVQKTGLVRTRQFDSKAEALAWEAQERSADWSEPEPEVMKPVTVLDWAGAFDHPSRAQAQVRDDDSPVSALIARNQGRPGRRIWRQAGSVKGGG